MEWKRPRPPERSDVFDEWERRNSHVDALDNEVIFWIHHHHHLLGCLGGGVRRKELRRWWRGGEGGRIGKERGGV